MKEKFKITDFNYDIEIKLTIFMSQNNLDLNQITDMFEYEIDKQRRAKGISKSPGAIVCGIILNQSWFDSVLAGYRSERKKEEQKVNRIDYAAFVEKVETDENDVFKRIVGAIADKYNDAIWQTEGDLKTDHIKQKMFYRLYNETSNVWQSIYLSDYKDKV